MAEVLTTIFQNANLLTIAITILIAVVGWIFALWLQYHNIKQQHRIQIRYEIYKQFVQLHKEIQDIISKLGAHSSPPFIAMESSMIPFQLKLKKEYKGQWIPHNEHECLFEGEKKWTEFVRELFDFYFKFTNKFLQLLYITEDWATALRPLLSTKDNLKKEVKKLEKSIHEQLETLRSYSNKYGHDWRKWNQQDAEQITQTINKNAMAISSYLNDFMVLIHNELLSSYFKYKRPIRKTLDPSYKVLTKDGIIENVDSDFVRKTEKWKGELVAYVKNKLQNPAQIGTKEQESLRSVVNGICPDCKTSILIMEKDEASKRFLYACGHTCEVKGKHTASQN